MMRLPLLGFSSPAAPSAWEVHSRGALPAPLCSASRFSQPPDGFLLPMPCGPVSCHWHPLGSPFRALFLARSRTASRRPLPSCRSPPVPRFRKNATTGRSRLQGLALLESPWLAACGLSERLPEALLGLCPSRVTHSARRKRCFHLLPLLSLTERGRNRDGRDFRGLPAKQHGWSPRRLPTLMGFAHLVKLADGLEARKPGLWFFLVPRNSVAEER